MGLNEVDILDDTFQASAKNHTAFGATMTLINTSDRYHDRSYLSKKNWLAKMKKNIVIAQVSGYTGFNVITTVR